MDVADPIPEDSGVPVLVSETPVARRRLIFCLVSISLLMIAMDQTIVATALPTIQHDLHSQVNWGSWTITMYAMGTVVVMPLAGKTSDHYGRKKILLSAVILFTVASLCCGLSENIYELVALRGLQAIGGGAIMPSASGIVSDHFGKDRDRALGLFISIFPIGAVIGPILGGIFVADWSWRGIFLVNVPVGIILVLLGMRYLPRDDPKPATQNDVRGALLLGSAILSTMFGVSYLGVGHTTFYSPLFLISESVAITSGWSFIRHTKRHIAPFIPARFLTGEFGRMNAINFIFGAAVMGFPALVPLYAEQRYGIHPLAAGTLLSTRAIGMIAFSGIAVAALRRSGYRLPMIIGFLLIACGLAMMAVSPHSLSPYNWLAVAAGITGVGLGIAQPASNNASMQLAPEAVAAISGLRGMFRQAGGIMAVSITTAILARSWIPDSLNHMSFGCLLCC